jgi:hypothetical protein
MVGRSWITGALAATLVVVLATQALGSVRASGPAYRVDGTVTVEWSQGPHSPAKGTAVYTISGPLLTNAQRQAYAPVVVPAKFKFRAEAAGYPAYLKAQLRSVTWTQTETIEGCGDGSETRPRTWTVEKIANPRAIFEQAPYITLNRLGGRSALEIGAITMYMWQDGMPVARYTNYSNLGEVEIRATGGCPEVLKGGPGVMRAQMFNLVGSSILQLEHLEVTGRKTADGVITFHGVNRSRHLDPPMSSTVKVTIDMRVSGPSNARGVFCTFPTDAQLAAARTVQDAQAMLHRAGIYDDRYGGDKRTQRVPAGRYFLAVGSPFAPCGARATKPLLFRATR